MISGEPIPVEKRPGDRVIGGTVNGTGSFVIRADRVGADTLLAQIVRMVAEAQRSRAPIQRLADVVAGYFVPAVIAVAAVTFVVWAAARPAAAPGPRPGQRRGGPDHRLPVRAGPGHADVDHGRHRPGRPGGRPDQGRRGPGDPGEGRHARGRQDRHPDRGQAATRLRARRAGTGRAGAAAARRRARARQRASRWRRPSSRRPGARGSTLADAEGFQSRHRQGRRGTVEGRAVALGNLGLLGAGSRRPRELQPIAPRRSAARARPWCSSPSTGKRSGCSASPTRSRRRRPKRSVSCTRRASASSC